MSILVRCLPLGCSLSAPDGTCHDHRVERTQGLEGGRVYFVRCGLRAQTGDAESASREEASSQGLIRILTAAAHSPMRCRVSQGVGIPGGGSTRATRLAQAIDSCNGASNQTSMLIRKGAATLLGCKLALRSGNKQHGQRHNRQPNSRRFFLARSSQVWSVTEGGLAGKSHLDGWQVALGGWQVGFRRLASRI